MESSKMQSVVADREADVEHDETSPLLPQSHAPSESDAPRSTSRPLPKTLLWTILVGVLLVSFGDQLTESPQTRIIEAIACYRHFEKADPSKIRLGRDQVGPGAIGGVAEMWCKTGPVQNEVAMLRGWQQLFEGIPVLLLAVPVGWVADNYGRKPILLLGITAFALRAMWIQLVTWFWQAFALKTIWFSAIFASIGGGSAATTSVFFVLLSDVTTEADRAEAFVRIGAFNLLAALLMPPLAAVLMEINPWIPNLAGTLLIILTLTAFFFLPETLHWGRSSAPPTVRNDLTSPTAGAQHVDDIPIVDGTEEDTDTPGSWISKAKHATAFLTTDWRVPALIAPFSIHILFGTVGQLLLQYVSTRYAVKLSKAIFITTIRTGVIALLLFVLLPAASTLLMKRYHLSAQRKDLFLARASSVLISLGWLLIGLSPDIVFVAISLVICALGWGAPLLLRSFLTSLIEKHHVARVYGVISVVDTLGAMGGSPLMAYLFERGIELEGLWLGLPFYFLGLLAACSATLLFVINLRKGEDDETPFEDTQ